MVKIAGNCFGCKKKKQKCNRVRPQCHGCQISQIPCIYPEAGQPSEREKYLEERLRQLENAFRLANQQVAVMDEYTKPSMDILNLHIDSLIDEGGDAAEAYALEISSKISLISPTALMLAKESSMMLKYCIRGFGFDFMKKTDLAELCLKKALQYFNETIENPSVVSVRALLALGMLHNRMNRMKEGMAYYRYGVIMAKDIGLNKEERLAKLCSGEFEKEECRKLWWRIYYVDQILRFKNRSILKDEDNHVFLPGSAQSISIHDDNPYLGVSILSSSDWFTPPIPNQNIHGCKILLARIFGKVLHFNHLYHHEGNKINVVYIHSVLENSLQLWWDNLPSMFMEHVEILHSGVKIDATDSWHVFDIYLQYTYLKAEVLLPIIFADIMENSRKISIKHLTQLTAVARDSMFLLQTLLPLNSSRIYKNPLFGIPIFHLAIAIYCTTLTELPQEFRNELELALEIHLACVREFLRLSAIKPVILDTFDYLIDLTDIRRLIRDFTRFKVLDYNPNGYSVQSNFAVF